jgi:AraC family transcriptional activator of pobA
MKHIKFNKTICGVDFLLNVLDYISLQSDMLQEEVKSTDFFQVVFIEQAQGSLMLNDSELELENRTVIFISQHQKHKWRLQGEFKAYFLIFQEEFLNEFFADKYFTYRLLYFYQTQYPLQFQLDDVTFNNYLAHLKEIKTELVQPKNDSAHLIRSLIYNILIRLNRTYSDINAIPSAIALDNVAYEFRKLVEEHLKTHQRIEDYTSLMSISRVQLNKQVKAQFNITASDFIKSKLLFEIKTRLIYTHQTIAEIAEEFNFSEPNHLSRLFRSREGVSPAQFRVNYQNGR